MLDITMPGLNGFDVLNAIANDNCSTKVVLLTATVTDGQVLAANAHGAKGIFLKDIALNDLVDCVGEVAAG